MADHNYVDEYLVVNRANWDERAPAHATSADYGVERFVADASFLSKVVRFDQPRLGDLTGVDGVHLQCHIGTDTISLARLGARMTGLDFSPASLSEARRLADRTGTPALIGHPAAFQGRRLTGSAYRCDFRKDARTLTVWC